MLFHWQGSFRAKRMLSNGEGPSGVPPFRTVISPAALAPGKRQGAASGSAGGLPGVPPFRTVISPAALAPGKRQGGASGRAGGLPGVPPFRTVISPAGEWVVSVPVLQADS